MNQLTYHSNELIGLTAWNSEEQGYYLVPFANVNSAFKQMREFIEVPESLVDHAFELMSEYNPITEVVLLTLNEDIITVSILSKNHKPSKEAIAEQLGMPLDKTTALIYMFEQTDATMKLICEVFEMSYDEYDRAMEIILG